MRLDHTEWNILIFCSSHQSCSPVNTLHSHDSQGGYVRYDVAGKVIRFAVRVLKCSCANQHKQLKNPDLLNTDAYVHGERRPAKSGERFDVEGTNHPVRIFTDDLLT